jgi:transcriptional regulator
MHEPSPQKIEQVKIESDIGPDIESTIQPVNISHQERLAKVLTLHSKGYTQAEIAILLNVNQATVSRDLNEIRKKARKRIDLYIKEEIPNEIQLYISGVNEITKNLWEIVEDKQNSNITTRDRTYILSLLMQCYTKRIEMLIGGPESQMNAKRHMINIKFDEKSHSTSF